MSRLEKVAVVIIFALVYAVACAGAASLWRAEQ